jgi:hypothetical protein
MSDRIKEDFIYGSDFCKEDAVKKMIETATHKQINRLHIVCGYNCATHCENIVKGYANDKTHSYANDKTDATHASEIVGLSKNGQGKQIRILSGVVGREYYDAAGIQNPKEFTKALRKTKYLFNLELAHGRDTFKTRSSPLDEATCKVCREADVTVVFNLGNLLIPDLKTGDILSRMIQNYNYVKRYKLNFCVGSFARSADEIRNPKDIEAFIRYFLL